MDGHGYFSYGLTNCAQQELIDAAEHVIVEVNPHMPWIPGLEADCIHVSRVDAIVENDEPFVHPAPVTVSEVDRQIAANIFPHLRDGVTLQLGIGGMPNALGSLIAESDLKDLGMHTELMSDGYLTLYRAGKITNAKKELNRGKGVFGIVNGSAELYAFLDRNLAVRSAPMRYINDPAVIRQFSHFVSINGCIAFDLYGQVCSVGAVVGVGHNVGLDGGQIVDAVEDDAGDGRGAAAGRNDVDAHVGFLADVVRDALAAAVRDVGQRIIAEGADAFFHIRGGVLAEGKENAVAAEAQHLVLPGVGDHDVITDVNGAGVKVELDRLGLAEEIQLGAAVFFDRQRGCHAEGDQRLELIGHVPVLVADHFNHGENAGQLLRVLRHRGHAAQGAQEKQNKKNREPFSLSGRKRSWI